MQASSEIIKIGIGDLIAYFILVFVIVVSAIGAYKNGAGKEDTKDSDR